MPRTNELTMEQIMLYHMSMDINQWLHQKGKDIDNYYTFMDRVCEIQEVLKGAISKTEESLLKYDPKTSKVKIVDFSEEIQ
jgi:hypothetical protein